MSSLKTSHNARTRVQTLLDDDDEKQYLSKTTINRREDQKLINNITSALYRLELENVKPSFEVKLRTGLHRGPYKSKRGRRSHITSTPLPSQDSDGQQYVSKGRPLSYTPSPEAEDTHWEQPAQDKLKLFGDGNEELLSAASRAWRRGGGENLPLVENFRRRRYDDPYIMSTVEKYASLPRKWLREMELIEEEGRRRAAVTSALLPPPIRQPSVTTDYDNLITYLQEPTKSMLLKGNQGFFDNDEERSPIDFRDEELEQLLDRPFVHRAQSEEGKWRVNRFNGSNDISTQRYYDLQ